MALLLSVLNAIMGCARSLYQAAEDGMLPRWFGHLNTHGVPDRAMAFNVVCSVIILLFGSPLRIYIISNIGYLFACMMGFFAYFAHRQAWTKVERPFRLPGFMRWVSLAIGIFCAVLWVFGGWNSPSVVVGTPSHFLFSARGTSCCSRTSRCTSGGGCPIAAQRRSRRHRRDTGGGDTSRNYRYDRGDQAPRSTPWRPAAGITTGRGGGTAARHRGVARAVHRGQGDRVAPSPSCCR